jgi:hypothetical protein
MPRWWPSIIKCVNGCFDSTEGQCLRLTFYCFPPGVDPLFLQINGCISPLVRFGVSRISDAVQLRGELKPARDSSSNGLTWTATVEQHLKFVATMMKACMDVANLEVVKVWGKTSANQDCDQDHAGNAYMLERCLF